MVRFLKNSVVTLVLFFLTGCVPDWDCGLERACDSSAESKKANLYVGTISPSKLYYNGVNSEKINIKECWLEKIWRIDCNGSIVLSGPNQLVVSLSKKLIILDKYSINSSEPGSFTYNNDLVASQIDSTEKQVRKVLYLTKQQTDSKPLVLDSIIFQN